MVEIDGLVSFFNPTMQLCNMCYTMPVCPVFHITKLVNLEAGTEMYVSPFSKGLL